jgi:hypothetical protein
MEELPTPTTPAAAAAEPAPLDSVEPDRHRQRKETSAALVPSTGHRKLAVGALPRWRNIFFSSACILTHRLAHAQSWWACPPAASRTWPRSCRTTSTGCRCAPGVRFLLLLRHNIGWLLIFCPTVFNLGEYRRARVPLSQPASFFHPDNEEASAIRLQIALDAMEDMKVFYVREGGQIAILDGTNSTAERRRLICDVLTAAGVEVVFVESVCDDTPTIDSTIMNVRFW